MTPATWAIAALTAALLLAIAHAVLTLDRLPIAISVAAAWAVSFVTDPATRRPIARKAASEQPHG